MSDVPGRRRGRARFLRLAAAVAILAVPAAAGMTVASAAVSNPQVGPATSPAGNTSCTTASTGTTTCTGTFGGEGPLGLG